MRIDEEKMKIIVKGLGGYLAEHIEKNGPVTAAFKPYGLGFEVYGTENKGMMQLSFKEPDALRLQLGIYRKGTDRLYSNYLPSNTAEEMIRYLKDPASHELWLTYIQDLSEDVDRFWKHSCD